MVAPGTGVGLKLSKLRIAIAVLVVALIFGILTLLFWSFVRDTIVVPVYYVVWVGGLVLKSIPQGIFAGILAVIGLLIGFNTLSSLPRYRNDAAAAKKITQIETRYQYWRRLTEVLVSSRFSRKLFIGDARKLILSILAYEHGLNADEIPDLVKSGELEVPDGIRTLFQEADNRELQAPLPPPEPIAARLRRWAQPILARLPGRTEARSEPQLDPLVTEIITFVETHLENTYAGNQPEL